MNLRCSLEQAVESSEGSSSGGEPSVPSRLMKSKSEAYKEWAKKNADKLRERKRLWHIKNREKRKEQSRQWAENNRARTLLRSCRTNARSRGLECTLTLEEVELMLAPMVCEVTGINLSWDACDKPNKKRVWAPSIDRINNELGYITGNCRVVCWGYNWMRGNMPDEDVLKIARALVERNA